MDSTLGAFRNNAIRSMENGDANPFDHFEKMMIKSHPALRSQGALTCSPELFCFLYSQKCTPFWSQIR